MDYLTWNELPPAFHKGTVMHDYFMQHMPLFRQHAGDLLDEDYTHWYFCLETVGPDRDDLYVYPIAKHAD